MEISSGRFTATAAGDQRAVLRNVVPVAHPRDLQNKEINCVFFELDDGANFAVSFGGSARELCLKTRTDTPFRKGT